MELRIESRPYDDAEVVRMVAEVQAIYVEMYGTPDEAVVAADEFVAPHGALFVGLLDDEVVATGGWRRLPGEAATAEIKRMYVSVAAQRRGVGRAILHAVQHSAIDSGIDRLVLNTGPHQSAAIALYEAEGYVAAAPFGHYADHGDALFMSKTLTTPHPLHDDARLA